MIHAHLDHKIRYLKQHAPERLMDDIARQTRSVLALQTQGPQLSEPLVRILQLDLCYAMWRHQTWLTAPVFPEVLMEFLNSDYKLPRSLCEELVDELSALIPGKEPGSADRDRLFLHTIFIACATARDEASLLADLGLGSGLLRRIKNAAESLVRNPGDQPDTVAFLPEVDGILHEVMTGLADELKVTPWACDLHRLRLLFAETDLDPWGETAEAFSRKSFQLLLVMGRAGGMVATRVEEEFRKLFPTARIDAKLAMQRLLELFIQEDLVFNDPSVSTGHWQLTSHGYELTAEAFACKYLRVPEPQWDQILHVQAAYQAATFRKIGPQHVTALMDLLRKDASRLSPKALSLVIERLSKHVSHTEVCALVRPILARKDAPWLKAAACEGLGLLDDDESVGQLLDELARFDASKRVQEAARLALTRWRHKISVVS